MKERLAFTGYFLLMAVASFPPAGQTAETDDDELFGDSAVEVYAELEFKLEQLNNYALGTWPGDNLRYTEEEITLALFYERDDLQVFAEITLNGEQAVFDDDIPNISESYMERGEMWLRFEEIFDTDYSIQIGRQNFFEPRLWWWDDDLDALRLSYLNGPWEFYIGFAEELGPVATNEDFIDPKDEDVRRLLGQMTWSKTENFLLEGFMLLQRDGSAFPRPETLYRLERLDESDADLNWLGLRALGFLDFPENHRLRYRLDVALVDGEESLHDFEDDAPGHAVLADIEKFDVRGWAVDFDLVWTLPLHSAPMLKLLFAYGSGDNNLDDGEDGNFRQTGLQDQDEEFRDYGVVLRPELSNLQVATLAFTLPLFDESSLTLGYHHFRQVEAARFIRTAEFEAEPTGDNKDLGEEFSLVFEVRHWEDLEIDFIAGSFKAGSAYCDAIGKRTNRLFFKLSYEF